MATTYTAEQLQAKLEQAKAAEKAALPALQEAQTKQNQAQAALDAAKSSVNTPPLPYNLKEITEARRAAANGDTVAQEKIAAQEAAVAKRNEVLNSNPELKAAETNLKDAKAETYNAQQQVNLAQSNQSAAEFKTQALDPKSDAAVFAKENPDLVPQFRDAPAAATKYASTETMQQIAADKQVFDNANKGIGPNDTATATTATTAPTDAPTSGTALTAEGGFTSTKSDGTVDTFNSKGEYISSTTPGAANSNTTAPGVNPNGDPNPNAVITPPTSDQPSNQKVANVDVTKPPASDTGVVQGLQTTNQLPEVVVTAKPIKDWRVRLSLANNAYYFYRDPNIKRDNILFPLKDTDGVVFPYLPAINVAYKANYNATDIVHTNYKNYFYVNSGVDEIGITADFTAQDNNEAKYMLAVIHFFRSVTKMFYGQDSDPRGGTPPPLCFLTGLGPYQFNGHPLVITSFSYNLPNDVDYIRTETVSTFGAGAIGNIEANKNQPKKKNVFNDFLSKYRLNGANLNKGARPTAPNFTSITATSSDVSYVPTKLQIQISAYPVVSRKDISQTFQLNGPDSYSSGELYKNNGIW